MPVDLAASQTVAVPIQSEAPAERAQDLAQIVEAYNGLTSRLQHSHEMLISEVKRLQGELASANVALQRSRRLAALGEMAAGIAHEIRNPLSSIQLYVDLLGRDLTDQPEQGELVGRIGTAVRGINAIVIDVLTFAREMHIRPITGAVGELFERALDAARPMIEQRSIRVVRLAGDNGQMLRYDPELMHRALVNLIRNALEAMERGGTLTLAAESDGEAVRLAVRDTGPGISNDSIDRIFNPFFTTRTTGTGLGLAIVHRIIDAHGGTIGVHNDGGAVFTLTLPAAAADGD